LRINHTNAAPLFVPLHGDFLLFLPFEFWFEFLFPCFMLCAKLMKTWHFLFEIDARWCTAEGLCGHSGKTISPQHSNMSLYASLYHIGAAGK
jgi:hypothetical protein